MNSESSALSSKGNTFYELEQKSGEERTESTLDQDVLEDVNFMSCQKEPNETRKEESP